MSGHRLEVADVFHAFENEFLQRWGHALSDQQRKVLRDIGRCRTAELGTHLERCDRCSYETVAYDSCRNRHCPKCQSSARDRWLLKQASSLLPVPRASATLGDYEYPAIARLKAGITLSEANADVARMIPIVFRSFPVLCLIV